MTANAPVQSSGAVLPARIVKGSFYQLQRTAPHPPIGWTITGATLFIKDREDKQLIEDGITGFTTAPYEFYRFDIGASATTDATVGMMYMGYSEFAIRNDADAERTETMADYQREFMLVDVPEVISQDDRILDLLLDTLEKKLAGRGDIVQYTIGDRQLGTMSLMDLNSAISYYRARTENYPKLRSIGLGDRYGLRSAYTGYRGYRF